MLCGKFQTKENLDPRPDSGLFGHSKEKTASLQTIRKALDEIGINADHYLIPEIDDFVKRRDWLAHRLFIDMNTTRAKTRNFQAVGLEELISQASRLIGVTLALSKHIAEKHPDVEALPVDHIVNRLTEPYSDEANAILNCMKRGPADIDSRSTKA
jgi:hypothetical protein